MESDISKLKEQLGKINMAHNGDSYEQTYGDRFKDKFPLLEEFWRFAIVPMTNRIEQTDRKDPIRFRNDVAEDLKKIAELHYSIFSQLVYAMEALEDSSNNIKNIKCNRLSALEDFYSHLLSACDLAEEFFLQTYILTCTCNNISSPLLDKLSKDQFLKLAEKWYDDSYHNIWTHYLSKGKFIPIKIPNGKMVVAEYFDNSKDWKQYIERVNLLRQYRNKLVHQPLIGKLISEDKKIFVPREKDIAKFMLWENVLNASNDPEKFNKCFVEMGEQMQQSIEDLQIILNKLWEKPVEDINKLLYTKNNKILWDKYAIDSLGNVVLAIIGNFSNQDTGNLANRLTINHGASGEVDLFDTPTSANIPCSNSAATRSASFGCDGFETYIEKSSYKYIHKKDYNEGI